MPNIRALNRNKYNISSNRFRELYYFCLQYNEWRDELKYKTDTIAGQEISDLPGAHSCSDGTSKLAMRRMELERNCRLIEKTAIEADAEIYQYLIKAATNENISFHYLKTVMDMPCERDTYYDRRRKFYWILSQKNKF